MEHDPLQKDSVLPAVSKEFSDEQSNEGIEVEHFWDADILYVNVSEAMKESSFATLFKIEKDACQNATALASNIGDGGKVSSNNLLGAWSLMELKIRCLDQMFYNATIMADETQMCITVCTVDNLGKWSIQEKLIDSWHMKHKMEKK